MGPKHNRGHTLDQIMYYDIIIRDVCQESVVSHHKCLLFNTYVQNTVNNTILSSSLISNSSAAKFCDTFASSNLGFESSVNINDAAAIFKSACNNIPDPLVIFKTRKLKTTPQPQLTNEIRSFI